jgi:hypothetical protein
MAKSANRTFAADGAERGSDTAIDIKIQFDAAASIKVECVNVKLLDDVSIGLNFIDLRASSLPSRPQSWPRHENNLCRVLASYLTA